MTCTVPMAGKFSWSRSNSYIFQILDRASEASGLVSSKLRLYMYLASHVLNQPNFKRLMAKRKGNECSAHTNGNVNRTLSWVIQKYF